MTDSIKLAEIHRTNVEYERQRHLANWLIKSSPHMAKPLPVPNTVPPPPPPAAPSKSLKKSSLKKSTSTQNPLFFLGKVNHASDANLTIAHPPIFNSHATLPVQNQLQSLPLGQPKVPRFIAQQYSNMFSVDDFENARLARRNELELKQMNRYKKGSLSSGGDCSTGDSKGSKFSTEVNAKNRYTANRGREIANEALDVTFFFSFFSFEIHLKIVKLRNVAGRFVFGTVLVATGGALDGNRIFGRNIEVIDFDEFVECIGVVIAAQCYQQKTSDRIECSSEW